MKTSLPILLALLTMSSCLNDDRANILVTSTHNGETVGQSMVYLIGGHNIDPEIDLKYYPLSQRSDGAGEAYFKGIEVGDYTIYVYGFYDNQRVEGRKEVIVTSAMINRTLRVNVDLISD